MAITTPDEVKQVAQLTNEYSDEEIKTEIDIVEAELYLAYYLPKRSSFAIDSDYTDFYIHTDKVHEVVRVLASVETSIDPSGYTEIGSPTYWEHIPSNAFITLTSTAITTYDNKQIRVQYTPKIMNLLATNLTALNLIDQTTIVDGEETLTPLARRIKDRIKRYKMLTRSRTIQRSSAQVNYDVWEYTSVSQSDMRNLLR